MKIAASNWYGIFNRKGDLEAVEEGEDSANAIALNLSPEIDGRKQLNRIVIPVAIAVMEPNDYFRIAKNE